MACMSQCKKKRMSFAAKVQYKAIPSENRGRSCKGQARKKIEGKWKKPNTSAGGATQKLQATTSTSRPRWADICEEEEEKEKNASGESDYTVDNIEAEAAGEVKASNGRKGRDKFGSNLYRDCQHISAGAPSQVLLDLGRHFACEVPSSGRQSISLSRLSKGELWDLEVSKGYRGWALTNCNVVAGHG